MEGKWQRDRTYPQFRLSFGHPKSHQSSKGSANTNIIQYETFDFATQLPPLTLSLPQWKTIEETIWSFRCSNVSQHLYCVRLERGEWANKIHQCGTAQKAELQMGFQKFSRILVLPPLPLSQDEISIQMPPFPRWP